MNKTELIAEVAKKCGMSKKDAEKAVTTTFDTIAEALSQGDKVGIWCRGVAREDHSLAAGLDVETVRERVL